MIVMDRYGMNGIDIIRMIEISLVLKCIEKTQINVIKLLSGPHIIISLFKNIKNSLKYIKKH